MRQEEAVALVGMVAFLAIYALTAVRDLPTIVGRVERLPHGLVDLPAKAHWERHARPRDAVRSYIGWTAFTQFVPVVLALAALAAAVGSSAMLGVASAAELAAAA